MAELKNVLLCHSANTQKVGLPHHTDDKGSEASDVLAAELVVAIPATAPLPGLHALTSELSAGSPVQGAWWCRGPLLGCDEGWGNIYPYHFTCVRL